jgi:hypothetical protein
MIAVVVMVLLLLLVSMIIDLQDDHPQPASLRRAAQPIGR